VPYPIQSGSITDRLRKFFRIRGKTGFALDEMVAPVVIVQDLTKGPYQSGVTPAAGSIFFAPPASTWSVAVLLNDKPGSITPVLGAEFISRTFSFLWAEQQQTDFDVTQLASLSLRLSTRQQVITAGVPISSTTLFSIQNNDGSLTVPVEMFALPDQIVGAVIWNGIMGDNVNTLGSLRRFEDIQPNITIGPDDALVFNSGIAAAGGIERMRVNVRGFYQEQPA